MLVSDIEVRINDGDPHRWLVSPRRRSAAYAALDGVEAALRMLFGQDSVYVRHQEEPGMLYGWVELTIEET